MPAPDFFNKELWNSAVKITTCDKQIGDVLTFEEVKAQYNQLLKENPEEVKVLEKNNLVTLGKTKSGIPYVDEWEDSRLDYYRNIFIKYSFKFKYVLSIIKAVKEKQNNRLTSKQRSLIILQAKQSTK